jgi:hypothetical protein
MTGTSRKALWVIGELACWRRRAGIVEGAPTEVAEPYALQLAGEWARAAEWWTELGCPYEAALALADANEEEPLRRALAELHRLGARPAAAIVARRLRERGVRGLPRGPRPATRQHPGRPEHPRTGGARPPRRAARARGQNGRPPRVRDPAQARRAHAQPGDPGGRPSGAARPRWLVALRQPVGRSPDSLACVGS